MNDDEQQWTTESCLLKIKLTKEAMKSNDLFVFNYFIILIYCANGLFTAFTFAPHREKREQKETRER